LQALAMDPGVLFGQVAVVDCELQVVPSVGRDFLFLAAFLALLGDGLGYFVLEVGILT
jgi:hypothetical protein